MQRDEFDDEALLSCSPLVLHTQLTENNSTSSELAQFEREDFKLRDHPTTRGIDWKSLPTLSDLLCGRIKGRETTAQITGFVNNIGLGAQFAAVGAKVYARGESQGSWPRGAAGLVYAGRSPMTDLYARLDPSYEFMPGRILYSESNVSGLSFRS